MKAYTAAYLTLTTMVMGHSLSGEIDRYKIRDSLKVKPACLELERYYFGKRT